MLALNFLKHPSNVDLGFEFTWEWLMVIVMSRCEVLLASLEGPCLHRPENWLMRQLIDL
jgi:hypothetical protein